MEIDAAEKNALVDDTDVGVGVGHVNAHTDTTVGVGVYNNPTAEIEDPALSVLHHPLRWPLLLAVGEIHEFKHATPPPVNVTAYDTR